MRIDLAVLALAVAALPGLAGCNEFEIVASCSDGARNGAESDADCGGACAPCALGRTCKAQADCVIGSCFGGICTPAPVAIWKNINPPSPPPPRFLHAMTYDGTMTLLFGGADTMQRLGDTWRWDGGQWTPVTPASPMPSPPPRYGASLVYDVGLQYTVLFSGGDMAGLPINDTWIWKDKVWTSLGPTMGPDPRLYSAATYDVAHQEIILFGGLASSATFGDTWRRHDITWQAVTAPGPPSRASAAMTYDVAARRGVLFGGAIGFKPPIPDLADTWTWDGQAWSNAAPDPSPPSRYGAAMVYDSARRRAILFGGVHSGGRVGDTWEWDGHAWSMTATTGPSPRLHPAMSYDPTRRRAVLFGGSADSTTVLGDTWEYNQIANPCRSDDDCDTGHCVDRLCCESQVCGSCEACNLPANPGRCTSCAMACTAGSCGP